MAVYRKAAAAMHFDPKKFDDQIEQHGTPVLWRKARTCPCLDARSGQPDPSCRFCFEGTLWDDGEKTKVFAPGRRRGDQYDETGYWMQGFVTLNFKSAITPGHFDRLDFLAARMVVNNDPQIRGSGKERTRMTVVEIEFCDAIVNGDRVSLLEGIHVDEQSNSIFWDEGHGPPDGARYSLRYIARPSFVAWSPMSRDENAVNMPYRATCQRLDFFKRPAPGGE